MSTSRMAAFSHKVFGKAVADDELQVDHQQTCFDPFGHVVMRVV